MSRKQPQKRKIAWLRKALLLASLFLVPALAAQVQFQVLHNFGNGTDGGGVWGSVTLDKDGNVYGTTSGGGAYGYGTVFELSPQQDGTWAETILHSFPAFPGDGYSLNGSLSIDGLGNLYGVTTEGGTNGAGTLFELASGGSGWTESILYNFCSLPGCADGSSPTDAPIMGPAGVLYGTTYAWEAGTAYELAPGSNGWTFTLLYAFCSQPHCGDGSGPTGPLTTDRAGNLYGMTLAGGITTGCPVSALGCGVIFALHPLAGGGWQEIVLHRFKGGRDGDDPSGGLVIRADALYGTTQLGGSAGCQYELGCGAVFELARNPGGPPRETILETFDSRGDGFSPEGGLVFDRKGNAYGATGYGGLGPRDCGVVYKLTPQANGPWKYTTLHTFHGSDGVQPTAGLTIDSRGNLYGTTVLGGLNGAGVVYEISGATDSTN